MLECKNLSISYNGKKILHRVSFRVTKGDIMCIIGPSGGGKTTLLRTIAGLVPVKEGQMVLGGKSVTRHKPEHRPVVLMFQRSVLFPHMTVLENVNYGLKLQKIPRERSQQMSMDILKRVGMEDYFHVFPYELSGGQQQRVAFARALVIKPKLLLFDEPFSSLDPVLRMSLRTWVRNMLKDEGMTALFVTHDKEEAMIVGDQIAVMANGMIHQTGSPLEVYKYPDNLVTAKHYSEGIILEDHYFISSRFLRLRKQSWQGNENEFTIRGTVLGKWMRSAQLFYQVEIPHLSQYIIMPSEEEVEIEETVQLTVEKKYITELNNINGEVREC